MSTRVSRVVIEATSGSGRIDGGGTVSTVAAPPPAPVRTVSDAIREASAARDAFSTKLHARVKWRVLKSK